MVSDKGSGEDLHREGKAVYFTPHTGKEKGPGKKGPVFFNPAMVQNRDLSVLVV